MAIAVFDYAAWSARYPALKGAVGPDLAALLFAEAELYLDNTDASPVVDPVQRLMFLNMIVAHLAVLGGALESDGQPTGIVGRITSATEGSVSVEADAGLSPGSAEWWAQTAYGFQFWAATRQYRTFRYYGGPQNNPALIPGFYGRLS